MQPRYITQYDVNAHNKNHLKLKCSWAYVVIRHIMFLCTICKLHTDVYNTTENKNKKSCYLSQSYMPIYSYIYNLYNV